VQRHPALTEADAWATEHRDLLERCFERFQEAGEWPSLEQLQHDYEVAGSDENVSRLAFAMPRPLGFVEQQRLVLLVRALSHVPGRAGCDSICSPNSRSCPGSRMWNGPALSSPYSSSRATQKFGCAHGLNTSVFNLPSQSNCSTIIAPTFKASSQPAPLPGRRLYHQRTLHDGWRGPLRPVTKTCLGLSGPALRRSRWARREPTQSDPARIGPNRQQHG